MALPIRILDVNDNPPELATPYEAAVCEDAKPGEVGQEHSAGRGRQAGPWVGDTAPTDTLLWAVLVAAWIVGCGRSTQLLSLPCP